MSVEEVEIKYEEMPPSPEKRLPVWFDWDDFIRKLWLRENWEMKPFEQILFSFQSLYKHQKDF